MSKLQGTQPVRRKAKRKTIHQRADELAREAVRDMVAWLGHRGEITTEDRVAFIRRAVKRGIRGEIASRARRASP